MKQRVFLLWLLTATTVMAAELPVRDGLILQLEASAQAGARQSASLPPLRSFGPVDFLLDGSGGQREVMQLVPERRPIFFSDANAAYLKFDGKDDFLALSGPRRSTPALTLFVLAAPKSNGGNFTALFGTAQLAKNDYTSGLNFDFGPAATKDLSVLNVESAGAPGFRDLLTPGFFNATERPFADFHVFTLRSRAGKTGVEVFLDGFKGGERERAESEIALDQITIGSRFYSNDPNQPPYAQGFFDGAIADVLLYNRALSEDERRSVEQALLAKTVTLNALLRGTKGHALETVKDPPAVQMFVPGFAAEEMPLKMRNLTGIRYRHDGVLVALGYDGRIHLVTDSNGDGREDKSTIFWDKSSLRGPIGMALLPKNDPRGEGVFVASKGKVSLIVDKDRDGVGDEEIIVAKGWREIFQSVDAIGLAVDPKDGSIYFGLGTENFANGFLIDSNGVARYRTNSVHGTIQRVSPDFSKRETVCTGVRFTCALAFNRHGDLFASEQEGATWLPNGNPFDELLHIQPGLHYGFPPRHPKHLPDVIDEPPVFDYGPQHQSTVGMIFNEGVNGGPAWGPTNWAGDALLCGESRGKLYRTKLVKTPAGYVAQNHLIASLTMLLVDACVTPKGDLLLACHSGPPDWGTGPAGEGKVFRIRYDSKDTPQPVLAWAAAPDEFRVAFDKPLKDSDWVGARDKTRIEAGRYVSAGDRFEIMRPGYQVVRDQIAAPRRWVEVQSLSLSSDRRTVVLRMPRQTEAVGYAITLPTPKSWQTQSSIAQKPEMDLALTLNGVQAALESGARSVLPHANLTAARDFTAGSADHEAFFQQLDTSGARALTLNGQVHVANIFVPAVQPGSKLDYDIATDAFANRTMQVRQDFSQSASREAVLKPDGKTATAPLQLALNGPLSLNGNGLAFALDDKVRPITLNRLFVPWASTTPEKKITGEPIARTDVKGNWLRGRRLFSSEAGCATCHTIRGEGIAFGPDLSNLIHRDRDSVLHDILQPSATINPDHIGSLVTLTDGTPQLGIVRTLDATKLVMAFPAGAQLEFPRAKIKTIEPLKASLMPNAATEQLNKEQLEDLLTFLLTNPLEPAPIARDDPPMPAARRMSEVIGLLGSPPQPTLNPKELRILLCAGPKDHGPDEHDYPLWLERWSRLLALGDNVTVRTAPGFPTTEQLSAADVAVFYNANPGWNTEKAALLDEFHKRGGGAVYLHYGVEGGKEPAAVAERMGLAFTLGSRFRHGEFDLVFKDSNHPITRGFPTLHFTDETYWNMRGDVSRLNVLGTSVEEGAPRPELWTLEREKSRIVGCIPGHYTWTFDDPLFRVLVLRSICWAAKQENVDRLAELAPVGARVSSN